MTPSEFATSIGRDLASQLADIVPDDSVAADLAVTRAMDWALKGLSKTNLWGRENLAPSTHFWQAAASILERGDLQVHARTKPRGYAGDFQLLEKIGQGHVRQEHGSAGGWERVLDLYFQAQAAPQAVRNRATVVADAIVGLVQESPSAPLKLVSVGSGPAADLRQALARIPARDRTHLHVSLLDLDPYALDFAAQKLGALIAPDQLTCQRVNLYRLENQKGAHPLLCDAHLIWATGFFDYLDQTAATRLVQLFWQHLTPGGRLLVFNFSHDNPSRAYMEWIGNWYLTYRSPDCLCEIAAAAGLENELFHVDVEPTGVNLFLSAQKEC